MTATEIIDACLKAIGDDTENPVIMSRTEVLAMVNEVYQEIIGDLLNTQKPATLTVSAGVASLPSDYLAPIRVYDGDVKLDPISDIDDKVENTDTCQQYYIPNESQIYFFGITPTTGITMYYKAKPAALTESPSTSPSELKAKFHRSVFTAYVKMVAANRVDNLNDYFALQAEFRDILEDIKSAHTSGRRGRGQRKVKARGWW